MTYTYQDRIVALYETITEENLESKSVAGLRDIRNSLKEVEATISFVRRKAQGWLDMIGSELTKRTTGDVADCNEIIEDLPKILSSERQGKAVPHPWASPSTGAPIANELEENLNSDLAYLVDAEILSKLDELKDDELRELFSKLEKFEHALSADRRKSHELIDSVQSHIINRYKKGDIKADELLK
jgi:hypothetical protein